MLISPTRSSWSRDRFSKISASGFTASLTWGTCSSSTSNAAHSAGRFNDRAATMPASMLAPSACEATSPRSASAAAVIRVVVDFPFVPVTTTDRFPRASAAIRVGSILRATRPPIIEPLPRPVFCDAHRAVAAARRASRARIGKPVELFRSSSRMAASLSYAARRPPYVQVRGPPSVRPWTRVRRPSLWRVSTWRRSLPRSSR